MLTGCASLSSGECFCQIEVTVGESGGINLFLAVYSENPTSIQSNSYFPLYLCQEISNVLIKVHISSDGNLVKKCLTANFLWRSFHENST